MESRLLASMKEGLETIVLNLSTKQIVLPSNQMSPGEIAADLLGSYDLFGTELILGQNASGSYYVDAGDDSAGIISIGIGSLFCRLRYATLHREVVAGQRVLAWSDPADESLCING